MSRASFSGGKRQREADKARKREEKASRKAERKARGGSAFEMTTAAEAAGSLPSIEEAMRNIEMRARAPRAAASIPARLFVGGLSDVTDGATLEQAFTAYGPVTEAVVIVDRDTGRSRGFGFVVMADRKDAGRAVQGLHNTPLDGRNIVVNVATERQR